jgi:ribose transport system substrate-binding protein
MIKNGLADFLNRPVPRRDILRGAAALGVISAFPSIVTRSAFAAGNTTVVNSIRSLSNPYHATWNKGGAAFAKSVGADYVTLVTEGNSEKGIADIKAILAKTGGNCVINVDPNDSPDARPIVQACKDAGAYVVTQWNDLHPWDFNPNYVAHISFSGVPYGKAMAETLIKAMGGKGGIVALGGIESNVPAIERKAGLMEALKANPGVQLLDLQVANWQATEALQKTNAWLTQFGDKIGGAGRD